VTPGRIKVLDGTVRVEIELPWVMQFVRDTITKRVRGRGVALLESRPASCRELLCAKA
jgi:hypothetical protein